MTSPDHIVPSKAMTPQTLFGLQNYDQAANAAQNNMWLTQVLESFRVNLFNNLLGGFNNVGAIVSEGITAIGLALTGQPGGLEALEAWANKLPFIGDIVEALTMKEDGDLNDLVSWALGALGRDTSLSGRVSKIEGKIAEGADFFDAFDRGDADNLGSKWRQFGTGTALGVYDQAAQIKRLSIGLQIGRQHAITEQELDGDEFTVQVVIHPAGTSAFVAMQLYARMNADCTEGLSVNLFGGKCYVARMTRNASNNNQTMVDLGSNLTKSYSNSATVTFQGRDDHLWLYIDSDLIVEIPPGSNVGPIDSAHRRCGFSEATVIGLPAQYSGAPASFSMRSAIDIVAVPAATAKAEAATEIATAVQVTVAQLVADKQTEISQGQNWADTFDRPDADDLGNGWITTYSGPGKLGIIAGAAAWIKNAGGGTGSALALAPVSFMTDSQSLIFVIGENYGGSASGRVWIRWNGNQASPTGLCLVYGYDVVMLLNVINGTTQPLLDRVFYEVKAGEAYEIRAGDAGSIIVRRNGQGLLSYPDSGAIPKGAGFRRFGLQDDAPDAYFNQYLPPSIASINASDFAPPAVRGTTWRAARLNTAATATFPSGDQRFPADTFGTVYKSDSVTLGNAGEATVPTEGTYLIKFRVRLTNSNNGYAWRPILWKWNTTTSAWVVDQYDADILSPNSNESQFSCAGTFQIYLKAGDKVAVGMRQAGTVAIVGSAGGADTYWMGTLINS